MHLQVVKAYVASKGVLEGPDTCYMGFKAQRLYVLMMALCETCFLNGEVSGPTGFHDFGVMPYMSSVKTLGFGCTAHACRS